MYLEALFIVICIRDHTFYCFLSQLDTCLRFLSRLAISRTRLRHFGGV